MYSLVKSNFIKQRRTFSKKLLFIAPITPMVLSVLLLQGNYFIENSCNWWYAFILPASIFIIVGFNISRERKKNRHGLFSICADKRKLWVSAVLTNTISLLILNLGFFICITICPYILGVADLRVGKNLLASFLLFITFSWQIPLFMFIAEKTGAFVAIFIGLVLNMVGIYFAPSNLWYIPFAIPSRLMCPVIGIMPNGLPVEPDSILNDSSVVLIGVVITIILYFIITSLTTLWYNKLEA
ncbi:hypothetical protein AN640_01395 [Candidatus Epulonipiscium fishelsonii]|uniref:Uncharacterized protein n=1 Tax=Candidatus Epulonipiscium fishelsonii TaxID=77094 RepID=A0ACC8XCB7_9FIRM|nr:hypothetical protein AN640_01395 [Epulopiscium sp. SCG-D08WGA-EpuloA1]